MSIQIIDFIEELVNYVFGVMDLKITNDIRTMLPKINNVESPFNNDYSEKLFISIKDLRILTVTSNQNIRNNYFNNILERNYSNINKAYAFMFASLWLYFYYKVNVIELDGEITEKCKMVSNLSNIAKDHIYLAIVHDLKIFDNINESIEETDKQKYIMIVKNAIITQLEFSGTFKGGII